jgi:hypothetical protein
MSGIYIEARVVSDARARQTRSGWQLAFDAEIAAAGLQDKSATFAVRYAYGQGEAAGVACRNKARCLRAGVRVQVRAKGGRGRVVLDGVQDINPPDLNPNHLHERIAP